MTPKKTWTASEILKQLDFKVSPQRVYTEDGTEIPDRLALMRQDTKQMLGMVSKRYKMTHPKDSFEAAHEAVKKQFGSNSFKITGFQLPHGGARSYVQFDIDNGLEVVPKDTVLPRLTMTDSFDGVLKYGFILGAFRVVCSNGMRVGTDMFSISKKHFSIEISEVSLAIQKGMTQLTEHALPMWGKMTQTQLTRDTFLQRCEDRLMPGKMIEEVRGSNAEVTNAWGMYNDFTAYLTHKYDKSYERQLQLNGQVMQEFEEVIP